MNLKAKTSIKEKAEKYTKSVYYECHNTFNLTLYALKINVRFLKNLGFHL